MTHLRRVATKTHRSLETAEKRQQINTGRWAAAPSLLNTVVFSEAEMNSKMFARPVYLERDAFRRNRKGDSFFCANQIHHSGR
ncbi:hypothetical protein CN067_34490 [Sinorhizobium meliloti]|nr:hypothetical protein CN111_34075 [Sinorhizobium meliloti]RVQ09550.1 hypothetical protein CN067_34490 [Sinorhizobium meliloti]RVQ21114.1 hypothetical protein CN062_33910 [Sinorhizobium meliloti]RVQ48594.1 hypothetical protein CN060_33105 [Sinorhizobium meliloti]